jgi:hypothetical protein
MTDPAPRPREHGPDFVGVGVQKSATTWLADVLAQHPQVLIREKEIGYFVRHFHKGWDWYERWFEDRQGRAAGKFSVNYMYTPRPDSRHREFYPRWNPRQTIRFWERYPSARDELAARYPDLRVFAMFRNPIDRAWSHYWYWRGRRERNGKRVIPFERMFADDGRWIRTQGNYGDLLASWRERFPRMGVYFYDDLRTDPRGLARQAFRFLGVDEDFEPSLERTVNAGRKAPMPPEVRALLVDAYRDQIERFGALAGRDLSHWLTAGRRADATSA